MVSHSSFLLLLERTGKSPVLQDVSRSISSQRGKLLPNPCFSRSLAVIANYISKHTTLYSSSCPSNLKWLPLTYAEKNYNFALKKSTLSILLPRRRKNKQTKTTRELKHCLDFQPPSTLSDHYNLNVFISFSSILASFTLQTFRQLCIFVLCSYSIQCKLHKEF